MKRKLYSPKLFPFILIYICISLMIISCENEVTSSLYTEDEPKGAPAEISSVSPERGYAGVTSITISGSNFASNADDNYVYFGSAKAEVLDATPTQLVVKAPVIFGDSLLLKIAKKDVENWSNSVTYELGSAVNEYYPFLANQEPYVATIDENDNIYFSYIEAAKGVGVWRITPDGTLSEFAPKGGETTFFDLKYHADGYLIGVWGNRAIFEIREGTRPAVFVNTGDNSLKFNTLDFDKDSTIWVGGKGGKIAGIKPDKSFKLFDYEPDISALRVYNNYLYAISGDVNDQSIVRFPILSPDSLGAAETYFNFSMNVDPDVAANTFTFSADGMMLIGISPSTLLGDPVDPLMYVNQNGEFGTWYSGLINSSISSITWSTGTMMYVIRDRYPSDRALDAEITQSILQIDMERLGSPHFGRD